MSKIQSFRAPLSSLANRCGADIGGTLAKLAYVREVENDEAVIELRCFYSSRIDEMIKYIREEELEIGPTLPVTGGGAYRHHDVLARELNVEVLKKDEMACAVSGLCAVIDSSEEAVCVDANLLLESLRLTEPTYPYLLVNAGSGVSVIKVLSKNKYTRVTGTCLGGGTCLGLGRSLFGATSYAELMNLSAQGSDALDLRVSDLIEGTSLPGQALASSFGRLYTGTVSTEDVRCQEVARSLVHMVAYNLGHIAYLVSLKEKTRRVFFGGKFFNSHDETSIAMESVAEGFFFQKLMYGSILEGESDMVALGMEGEHQVLFTKYNGYIGAIGSILQLNVKC